MPHSRQGEVQAIDDIRFTVPLYTLSEAGRLLGVPTSTLSSWARGYDRRFHSERPRHADPIITELSRTPMTRDASVPFVGLAEALVLAAFRRTGVSMQKIRPTIDRLKREVGLDHALASRHLFTDGAEILYDFAKTDGDSDQARATRELVQLRDGQRVFTEIVQSYLRRVQFDGDEWATRIALPDYGYADVLVDPHRGFGQPIFAAGGARIEDVLGAFHAGDSVSTLSMEYGVPPDHIEDVIRVALRVAA